MTGQIVHFQFSSVVGGGGEKEMKNRKKKLCGKKE